MFRGGQPYTEFKGVNCNDGRLRFEGSPNEVKFEVDNTTLTDDRKVYVCDSSGSMFVKGYHIIFGTAQAIGTMSLVPVGGFMTSYASVSGALTTSIVFANIYNGSSAAGIAVGGACCAVADQIQLQLTNVTAATIANGALYINYMVLNPQTS
jgi:hypothetical protein